MLAPDEETPRPRLLNLLIVVTLATIVIALGYLLDYYLRDTSSEVTWYPPAQGCELLASGSRSGCSAGLGLDATLSFALRESGEEGSMVFKADVSGVEPQAVEVEFIGRDVNVRSQRFRLTPNDEGVFVGHGALGVCSAPIESWRAQVSVRSAEWEKGSWFDFERDSLTQAGRSLQAQDATVEDCLWTRH